MTEKLKPCPFCSSPRIKIIGYFSKRAVCQNCGSSSRELHSKRQVIVAWNQRANNGG
ncbi:Lar family restriction alleviation protein [Xenorhabdus griffiniae]|uniref:Lar family restriction alleviation protein n=1 Tax=Xenorhabdus griffiniae TaxID=351672 RepID=UPI001677B314|nr:Lar family restriction alleviation protein [Xenorhabdus griffiniae]MBE8588824.1 Lar family restriction alleviation protein [Xenorhabdus griffiniae]